MRLLAFALLGLLAGCTILERAPPVVVKNDTNEEITGEAFLYEGDTLVAKWGFTVPGLAFREIARLPRDAGEHRIVVELDDGREGEGRARSGVGQGQLLVRVGAAGVVVEPQTVR